LRTLDGPDTQPLRAVPDVELGADKIAVAKVAGGMGRDQLGITIVSPEYLDR
jgi:hypothetical protein